MNVNQLFIMLYTFAVIALTGANQFWAFYVMSVNEKNF